MSVKFAHNLLLFKQSQLLTYSSIRTLLSKAYACSNEWNQRFEEPVLSKIENEKFFFELNQRFAKKQVVNAIDLDLFVNSIRNKNSLDELEHLLAKFRKNWRTRNTLPSTHHTIVRLFIDFDQGERLLKLLENRVWIGIFPDEFGYNLLLDHFLESKRFDLATRTACLMCFQEDFQNPIANRLAFLSLASALKDETHSPLIKSTEATEEVSNEDDEIEYKRVPYVRNPYFDDHFDLTDAKKVFGKSLYLLSFHVPNAIAHNSGEVIGLALYGKWEQLQSKLESISKEPLEVSSDSIEMIKQVVDNLDEPNETASKCLQLLSDKCKQSESSLFSIAEELSKNVHNFEKVDQEKMKQLFKEWNQIRQQTVEAQLDELMKEQKLNELRQKRQELLDEEEKLFFFDNLDRNELKHEKALKRIEEMKSKMEVDEEYIPPKIN